MFSGLNENIFISGSSKTRSRVQLIKNSNPSETTKHDNGATNWGEIEQIYKTVTKRVLLFISM